MKRKLQFLLYTLLLLSFSGNAQTVANQPPNLSGCFQIMEDPIFDLTAQTPIILGSQDPALYTVTYFDFFGNPETNSDPIEDPTYYYTSSAVPNLNVIHARVTNNNDGTYAITSFTVENISLVSMIDAMVDCDGFHMPSNNIGHFYTGPNGTGDILDGTVVTSVMPIYFHAEYNGCIIDFEFMSEPEILPFTGPLTPLTGCDNDMNGIATFDLSSKIPEALMGVETYPNEVSFHLTATDGENGSNPITNITTFVNTIPFIQTIYVRKTYSGGCETTTSMELITGTCTDNTVSGTVSYNTGNNDCSTDAIAAANMQVKLANSTQTLYTYSNALGNYSFANVDDGESTVTVEIQGYNPYTTTPANYTVTVPENSVNNNFCISAESANNISVGILPFGQAQPGFMSGYGIHIMNQGSYPKSGTLTLTFDTSKVNYTASQPAGTVAGNTVTFNYSIDAFSYEGIFVQFTLIIPPTVNQGDVLNYTVALANNVDDVASDDFAVLNQTVVNSFDPNDITVHEGEFITEEQTDDYLHYTIRFQNTGNADATFIRVETALDENLDWSTFQPLTASHSYTTSRVENEITFRFDDIYLPGSNNEPESHGYITYKIKPIEGLALGDQMSATANIFFDFNLPITTNTATTTVQNTMGVEDVAINNFVLYPNPAKAAINVRLNDFSGDGDIKITNLLGKTILSRTFNFDNQPFEMDITSLSGGIYLVTITADGMSATKKLVVQ